MKYQLVLQFPEDAMDFDGIVSFENTLISIVKEAVVDGHDIGSGEINIFINTNEPKKVLQKIAGLLEDKLIRNLKAAYREMTADEYTILWPTDLKDFQLK